MSTARPRIQATPTCSLRVSGAIICPTITCALARSAIACAAIAATTRTQSPSSLLIGLSEYCGAERTDHRRRAVSGLSCFRSPAASQCHCSALCGRPAITRRGIENERWRGPPPSSSACPPTRPQRALWESCITYWASSSSLLVSFHSYNAIPSYEYLGCYFEGKSGGRPCGYRRPAGRWSGRWRGVAVPYHVQRSHRCPRHRPEARTSRAAPAPRSGYPIQIVSNRLLAHIFVTGNIFTES